MIIAVALFGLRNKWPRASDIFVVLDGWSIDFTRNEGREIMRAGVIDFRIAWGVYL